MLVQDHNLVTSTDNVLAQNEFVSCIERAFFLIERKKTEHTSELRGSLEGFQTSCLH